MILATEKGWFDVDKPNDRLYKRSRLRCRPSETQGSETAAAVIGKQDGEAPPDSSTERLSPPETQRYRPVQTRFAALVAYPPVRSCIVAELRALSSYRKLVYSYMKRLATVQESFLLQPRWTRKEKPNYWI